MMTEDLPLYVSSPRNFTEEELAKSVVIRHYNADGRPRLDIIIPADLGELAMETLEALRDGALAHREVANDVQEALGGDGIPIRSPRLVYFIKRYAWQILGGITLLFLGVAVKQYETELWEAVRHVIGWSI